MNTSGLRRIGNYEEEVLAQAIKDEQHVAGVMNQHLTREPSTTLNFRGLGIGCKTT